MTTITLTEPLVDTLILTWTGLEIHHATTQGGTYTLLAAVPYVLHQTSYTYVDGPGLSTDWYAVRRYGPGATYGSFSPAWTVTTPSGSANARSRLQLRQRLGQLKLRDTLLGTTSLAATIGVGAPVVVLQQRLANSALTAQALYGNSVLRIVGEDFHVASFNAASGAFVSAQTTLTAFGLGTDFEIHRKVSAAEKDRAIDGIVAHLWTRQEIPLVGAGPVYSLGTGKVFGAYYFAGPTATGNHDRTTLPLGWDIRTTGSGREFRLPQGFALGSGAQLILDAQVRATLGALDTDTVDVPDEDWVLNGMAARCYQTMIADAPGQEAGKYRELAQAYANEFVKGIGRYRSEVSYGWRGSFDEVVS